MNNAAKVAGAVAAWLAVAAWSWFHPHSNGATLIVELAIVGLIVYLICRRPSRCPHCCGEFPACLTDTCQRRGDGI